MTPVLIQYVKLCGPVGSKIVFAPSALELDTLASSQKNVPP